MKWPRRTTIVLLYLLSVAIFFITENDPCVVVVVVEAGVIKKIDTTTIISHTSGKKELTVALSVELFPPRRDDVDGNLAAVATSNNGYDDIVELRLYPVIDDVNTNSSHQGEAREQQQPSPLTISIKKRSLTSLVLDPYPIRSMLNLVGAANHLEEEVLPENALREYEELHVGSDDDENGILPTCASGYVDPQCDDATDVVCCVSSSDGGAGSPRERLMKLAGRKRNIGQKPSGLYCLRERKRNTKDANDGTVMDEASSLQKFYKLRATSASIPFQHLVEVEAQYGGEGDTPNSGHSMDNCSSSESQNPSIFFEVRSNVTVGSGGQATLSKTTTTSAVTCNSQNGSDSFHRGPRKMVVHGTVQVPQLSHHALLQNMAKHHVIALRRRRNRIREGNNNKNEGGGLEAAAVIHEEELFDKDAVRLEGRMPGSFRRRVHQWGSSNSNSRKTTEFLVSPDEKAFLQGWCALGGAASPIDFPSPIHGGGDDSTATTAQLQERTTKRQFDSLFAHDAMNSQWGAYSHGRNMTKYIIESTTGDGGSSSSNYQKNTVDFEVKEVAQPQQGMSSLQLDATELRDEFNPSMIELVVTIELD